MQNYWVYARWAFIGFSSGCFRLLLLLRTVVNGADHHNQSQASHNAVWAWALKRLEEAHCKLQLTSSSMMTAFDYDANGRAMRSISSIRHMLHPPPPPICYKVSVVCVLWYMVVSPSTQAACIIKHIVVLSLLSLLFLLFLLLLLHAPVSGNIKAKCPKINWDLKYRRGQSDHRISFSFFMICNWNFLQAVKKGSGLRRGGRGGWLFKIFLLVCTFYILFLSLAF